MVDLKRGRNSKTRGDYKLEWDHSSVCAAHLAANAPHPRACTGLCGVRKDGGEGSQRFSHLLLPPDSCYLLDCGGATLERDGVVT